MADAKTQAKKTKTAQARTPDLAKLYHGHTRQPSFDPVDFRLLVYDASVPTEITTATESYNWDDVDALLTGTIALRKGRLDAVKAKVLEGSRIECVCRYAGRWTSLWRLRGGAPAADDIAGTISADIADQFSALHDGKRQWVFRSGKSRPHGWFAHEVAANVAPKCGVLVGALAQGTERFHELKVNGSGLDAITAAYAKETTSSGRRFVTRMRNGKLEVVPFQRNPFLYVVADRFTEQSITQAYKTSAVTVLKATGRLGEGKHAKKITYVAKDPEVVRRLGYVRDEKSYGRVRSHRELRSLAKRDLADMLRRTITGSVTIPGLPFIYRGETHQVIIPPENMLGPESFIYTTGVHHAVDPAGYFTTVDITSQDRFLTVLADQEKAIRAVKRKARERRKT